jgi:hypothetical protein
MLGLRSKHRSGEQKMRGKLFKVESTHNNIRTDEIVGDFMELPKIGYGFVMYAPPLDPEYVSRVLRTTPVKSIEPGDGHILFKTMNSTYRLVTNAT